MSTYRILVTIHRWLGLSLAAFLFIVGLTGSIIVFDPEIDRLLNPELFDIDQSQGEPLPAGELIRRVEADDPRVEAYYIALADGPRKASVVYVTPRTNPATGKSWQVGYDEVFVDPFTGNLNGKRLWGACCFERPNFVPFMYKLHNRLLLPMNIGRPLLGIIALACLVLILVGGYLTLPRAGPREHWRHAWKPGRGNTSRQTNLRYHRATGLWLWPVTFALLLTGAVMALEGQLFKPVLDTVSPVTPTVWEKAAGQGEVLENPGVSYTQAVNNARQYLQNTRESTGESMPDIHHASYSARRGLYRIGFGDERSAGGGITTVYVDGGNGEVKGRVSPGDGTLSDVVLRGSQPVHAGRIAGLPGRIVVFLAGLAVTLLSVTGLVMWSLRRGFAGTRS